MINLQRDNGVTVIELNDPARRNALGVAMFDALDAALATCARDDSARVVVLCGSSGAFSTGFDLGAAVEDPALLGTFIARLSGVLRTVRRLPQPVIAAVEGAAIAGGCAIVSACDFAVASPESKLGYPVHGIGVSPAVTLPTLAAKIGDGSARALTVEGRLLTGAEAHRIGLVSHLAGSADVIRSQAMELARQLAAKPPQALRVTKAWLNELDGSLENARFDGPVQGSAHLPQQPETIELLRTFWAHRQARSDRNANAKKE